jgi:MFS family permease
MQGAFRMNSTSTHRLLADRLGPVATVSIAQLFGTSLWFSANSAADDLIRAWQATPADIGWLTSAVQAGFILGTLVMSLSGLADRFRASTIFVVSAVAGAAFNACFALLSYGLIDGAVWRVLVGMTLAGIYPVGMKLIVGWAPERTGTALALLIAMLTLGTALPHALRALGAGLPWQYVIIASSILALLGALMIWLLGDGPQATRPAIAAVAAGTDPRASHPGVMSALRRPAFRAAMWGYFGHMWELYTFWTIVPLLITGSLIGGTDAGRGVSGLAFAVIATGALGCIIGGMLSRRLGNAAVALGALTLSGICAVLFALGWRDLPTLPLLTLILIWGAAVVADSPQFSALAAQSCPPEVLGSALSIMNSVGFAITVVSIALVTQIMQRVGLDAIWLLVPGPALGIWGFFHANRSA